MANHIVVVDVDSVKELEHLLSSISSIATRIATSTNSGTACPYGRKMKWPPEDDMSARCPCLGYTGSVDVRHITRTRTYKYEVSCFL